MISDTSTATLVTRRNKECIFSVRFRGFEDDRCMFLARCGNHDHIRDIREVFECRMDFGFGREKSSYISKKYPPRIITISTADDERSSNLRKVDRRNYFDISIECEGIENDSIEGGEMFEREIRLHRRIIKNAFQYMESVGK